MARCIEYLTDRVEVPFTKNGSNQLVSLAPYVRADTKMVLLQVANENTGTLNANAVGQGYADQPGMLSGRDDYFTVCECDDPSHNVILMGQNSGIHVYLHAIFYGGGIYANPSGVKHHITDISQNLTWVTRAVTLAGGDPDDVEAVVLVVLQTDLTYSSSWGARCYGSTVDKIFTANTQNRIHFLPVKTYSDGDDALFQTFLSVKPLGGDSYLETIEIWEIGYIKKDYSFVAINEVADEEPPSVGDWTLRAVSSQVPSVANGICGIMEITHPYTAKHGLRASGSSNPVTVRTNGYGTWARGAGCVELDSQDRYEYYVDGAPGFWIYGYTVPDLIPVEGLVSVDAILVAEETEQEVVAVLSEASQDVIAVISEESQDVLATIETEEQTALLIYEEPEQTAVLDFGGDN